MYRTFFCSILARSLSRRDRLRTRPVCFDPVRTFRVVWWPWRNDVYFWCWFPLPCTCYESSDVSVCVTLHFDGCSGIASLPAVRAICRSCLVHKTPLFFRVYLAGLTVSLITTFTNMFFTSCGLSSSLKQPAYSFTSWFWRLWQKLWPKWASLSLLKGKDDMTLARYRAICVTCLCKGVCFRLTHLNPKSVTNMQHVALHPSNAIS